MAKILRREIVTVALAICAALALLLSQSQAEAVGDGARQLRIGVFDSANVFTPAEAPHFQVYAAVSNVQWIVRDSDGTEVSKGNLPINLQLGKGTLEIPRQPAGYYTLSVSSAAASVPSQTRRAGFAVLEPGAQSDGAQPSIFGVNTHGASWDSELYQHAIGALKQIGVRYIRDDNSYWDQVEKQPGKYGFAERSDQVVQKANDAGIEPLVLLAYNNRFYDKGETPNSDAAIEAAGKYAAAVVQHYGKAVPAVEVWNEYYGGFSTGPCKQSPECYFRLLRSVYVHVKAVSPNTLIVAPAAFKVPVDWLSALFEQGALEYLDVVSIHPYRSPGRPEGLEVDLENLQTLIKKYNHGKPKPIWITEQGWSTQAGHPAGVDERHQALYAVRSAVIAQSAGVERNYWYDLLNDGTNPSDSEQNFGLLRRPDENADGITPKPAYVAYGVAARLLAGRRANGSCLNDAIIRCYRFDGARGPIRVAWTNSSRPETVAIHTAQPVTPTDLFGRTRTLRPVDGQVAVELTESPVYLSGDGELSKSDAFRLQGPEMSVAVGQPIPLTVNVAHCGRRSKTGHAGIAVIIDGTKYSLSQCTATIKMPPQSEPGARTFAAEAQANGINYGYAVTQVDVSSDVISARISPAFIRNGDRVDEQMEVAIQNHSSRTDDSVKTIDWIYGSQSGEIEASTAVHPLSHATVTIPIRRVAWFGSETAKVTVHMASGRVAVNTSIFGFSPVMRATPQLIAGRLRGLEHIPPIDLAASGSYKSVGPEEISGKMWMSWDDRNLYIAARVSEANYVLQKNPRWLQAGDSVGIGLQPGEPGAELGRSGADWYNLYAGMTSQGPAVFRESLPTDILTAAHLQVERDEKEHITTYLIALPWNSLPPLSPDHPLFSAVLTLNKNDGKEKPGYFSLGLKGWEGWGDGLNNFRLDRYQTVVLVR